MNQLVNVKILILISAISFGLLGTSYGATISPELGCGIYDLHGTLVINSSGHFILKIQEDSYSPIEILLLGGSYSDKLRRRNTQVTAKVYVPKIITDNNAPIVYLQELMPSDPAKVDRQISISEKMDCNISGYFRQKP
ncbi:MAG: hypothetical protein JNM39_13815 [Bdellovibrionaceae bacterium]|nr:hypothetical protein [Pseudobdellovibrionaceae bacterium]